MNIEFSQKKAQEFIPRSHICVVICKNNKMQILFDCLISSSKCK